MAVLWLDGFVNGPAGIREMFNRHATLATRGEGGQA
jgi:hypothetical protein